MSKFLLLTFVCSLTALHNGKGLAAIAGDINNENDGTNYRLPDSTEPVSYDLRITPDIENLSFHGQVDIVVKSKQYTTEVILNSKDLILSSVPSFQDLKTNRSIEIKSYAFDERNEWLVVKLKKSIIPQRLYKFTVVFSGILRDDYTGFHKYFYDSGNHSRWIALTQFKPIYARRAFPCYDEPKFKTPYTISIGRQNQHSALSNMPLNYSEIHQQNGWVWDHFKTTKPIPTYLVAFMVSDFDKNYINGDNIAMHTRKEYIEYTTYMMGKAPNLLRGVETFTQIPYMLPKLDLVGVPLLNAYSMENWGLNSYEEFYVTLSKDSQTEDKIQGSMTVLHEILHQWFGNMVTTPWWDNAWLNEGMCNYLNYYITSMIEPEWDMEESFVEKVHQYALSWDEYDDTHPLTFAVSSPDDIENAFDTITIDKSAALFRMLKCVVGEENFRTSVNKYLNDFAYMEAEPEDLWDTFDYVLYDADNLIEDDITINNYMDLWTKQPGYPLITVKSANNGSVVASQKRFCLSNPRRTTDNVKWFVGLTYTTESEMDFEELTPTVWMKPTEEHTALTVPENFGWIIVNIQSTGFYRVNYDEKNWKLLLIQLITNPDRIHVLNRAQIVDDVYHLCRAALLPYDYYTSLLEYLLMEDHVMPWNAAITGLSSTMDSIRRYPTEYLKFKKYAKGLADILYDKLSENQIVQIQNATTRIGWSRLLTWTCSVGNSRCAKSASRHFDAWMTGHEIPHEMEEAALCAGMKKGNIAALSKIHKLYSTTRSPSQKKIILRALACTDNIQMLMSHLDLMRLDDVDHGSLQSFKTVCDNVVTTPVGVKALSSFLIQKLNAIQSSPIRDNLNKYIVVAYSALAPKVATDDEIAVMDKIRGSVISADLKIVLDEIYQKIESNLLWMERDHKKIMRAIKI
ncbi:thyrotropin-releasing hormone-degrading ectoenzyme-like [Rhopalosiphum padi]|uniref:thyrotropin-releasing hormone-degrading ectoenzyme-like n=1 Tax=Rhopalosiphum padi TaxID=40932 RepID=UPI00298EB48A|nr:thyrotropin-releasing hormone-degrading ectoenzyme-like [Rhopalosiphum padi]